MGAGSEFQSLEVDPGVDTQAQGHPWHRGRWPQRTRFFFISCRSSAFAGIVHPVLGLGAGMLLRGDPGHGGEAGHSSNACPPSPHISSSSLYN